MGGAIGTGSVVTQIVDDDVPVVSIAVAPSKNITEETVKKTVIKYVYECNNTRKKVTENKNGVFILKNIYYTKNDVLKGQKKNT